VRGRGRRGGDIGVAPAERRGFPEELGFEQSGLGRTALAAYRLLGLITSYRVANEKLRACRFSREPRPPRRRPRCSPICRGVLSVLRW